MNLSSKITIASLVVAESHRLFDLKNIGDSVGLWIQTAGSDHRDCRRNHRHYSELSKPNTKLDICRSDGGIMAKIVCKIVGVLYFLAGSAGLVFGDRADRYHNVLHLVTGIVALRFGFAGSRFGAKVFCLAFGIGYLTFGILGFALGSSAMGYLWDIGLISVSMGDHIHHIVLGTIILAGGIFTKIIASTRTVNQ